MDKNEIKKAMSEYFEEQNTKFEEEELLRSAKFWLDSGKWDKRGKRAYSHSVATSLLSIAQSLDKLTRVSDLKPSDSDTK